MKKHSYREILRGRLQEKIERNSRYSLRAFATLLGISPALLSQVLSGKRGLSLTKARAVAQKLRLTKAEQDFFCDLVTAEHHKNDDVRIKAQARVDAYVPTTVRSLSLESFARVHEWYHFAILEAIRLTDFQPSVPWLARKLNVAELKVRLAVERMVEMGLLEITPSGQWVDTQGSIFTGSDADVIKATLRQYLVKASEALELFPSDKREHASFVFAAQSEQIEEARRVLREFCQSFTDRFGSLEGEKDVISVLSIQLFPLSR